EAVRPTDTAGDLLARLAESGADLLLATIDGIADGTLTPVPQSTEGVSLAPKVTVEQARVRWDLPLHCFERRIRTYTPSPAAWTMIVDRRVKSGPVTIDESSDPLPPGKIEITRKVLRIGTGSAPVLLGTVQAPGKKAMSAADWA